MTQLGVHFASFAVEPRPGGLGETPAETPRTAEAGGGARFTGMDHLDGADGRRYRRGVVRARAPRPRPAVPARGRAVERLEEKLQILRKGAGRDDQEHLRDTRPG